MISVEKDGEGHNLLFLCYRSGTVNSNTVNSNFHLIRSKTLPVNDFELSVPDLY